jgi:hypothetical protein
MYVMEGFREDGLGFISLERYDCGPMPPWAYRGRRKKNTLVLMFLFNQLL